MNVMEEISLRWDDIVHTKKSKFVELDKSGYMRDPR